MRKGSRWVGVVAGMLALAATPALAQEEGQGHERHRHDPEQRLERLQESLSLTDAQVAEVRAIFAEQGEKRRALKESEDREGLRALHQETHDRLASVLDEAQRAKLEEHKQRMGQNHREHEGDHREHDGGHDEHAGDES